MKARESSSKNDKRWLKTWAMERDMSFTDLKQIFPNISPRTLECLWQGRYKINDTYRISLESYEKTSKLREVIQAEYERMETITKARGISPENMPTWKNVSRLLEKLEEILDS
jgi:hypothetical protein